MPITISLDAKSSVAKKAYYNSPLGVLEITGTDEAVHSVLFTEDCESGTGLTENLPAAVVLCYHQLDEYFKGARNDFDLPVAVKGTPFQQNVWQALTYIPYGQTASYGDIACAIGSAKAVRAVGSANGKNQLTVLVPCHRIIGKNGTLTGYAGGVWRKEWLLAHEQTHKQ
ncbi:methylated-DNA--protein-cysteine methyltransferase [Sporosarcina sp. NCCP-2716]|uniref:methylated-DNA--[protein]-cysteine S-methyltransferase n=1 Tax=Sporosarcina sp. NCCP-2716 TaxID=2943679 RepID=UPI0020411546|nr:methylated-DNA--[protein]-cysteine S-methyltransferase [Sporosarcina sp. NCCP-2716]GKV68614.1 methylated-DNA--protein-cysteine methyltransferase [Sporosarcina sp. NCCP-2716]